MGEWSYNKGRFLFFVVLIQLTVMLGLGFVFLCSVAKRI